MAAAGAAAAEEEKVSQSLTTPRRLMMCLWKLFSFLLLPIFFQLELVGVMTLSSKTVISPCSCLSFFYWNGREEEESKKSCWGRQSRAPGHLSLTHLITDEEEILSSFYASYRTSTTIDVIGR